MATIRAKTSPNVATSIRDDSHFLQIPTTDHSLHLNTQTHVSRFPCLSRPQMFADLRLDQRLLGDAHEQRRVLEVLVALAERVAQVQRAQAGLETGHRQRGERDEVVADHVLIVDVEGQVRQVGSAHVERERLSEQAKRGV
jgi:hypothetical protein